MKPIDKCYDYYEKLIILERHTCETLRYEFRFYELKRHEYNAQQYQQQTVSYCARGGILCKRNISIYAMRIMRN